MLTKLTFTSCLLLIILIVFSFVSCKKSVDNTPVLTTKQVTGITKTSAHIEGILTLTGGLPINSRGICLSKKPLPTLIDTVLNDLNVSNYNTINEKFSFDITNLNRNTKYYIRAFATNKSITGYGNVESFTTQDYNILFNANRTYGTVNDVDGNVYKTIKIGTQTWMAENLKTIHYRDGSLIQNVPGDEWYQITTDACCDINNTPILSQIYGKLYNWYVVKDSRKIAPIGWHIATKDEWDILTTYLGPFNTVAGKMRECGLDNWRSPNVSTNESGFTALPNGGRDGGWNVPFYGYAEWWCDTDPPLPPYRAGMSNESDNIYPYVGNGNKNYGYALRCVKDI